MRPSAFSCLRTVYEGKTQRDCMAMQYVLQFLSRTAKLDLEGVEDFSSPEISLDQTGLGGTSQTWTDTPTPLPTTNDFQDRPLTN